MTTICEHGSQMRKCVICENEVLEREIQQLRAEIEVERAKGMVALEQSQAWQAELAAVHQQRDELLVALTCVLPQYEALLKDCGLRSTDTVELARAAIAKVKT